MDNNNHNKWDIRVKLIGYIGASIAFIAGVMINSNMEKKKNFWASQNQIYSEICNNAGAMVANISDRNNFEVEKTKFLTHYYGEVVLVEDTFVENSLVTVQSALFDFDITDIDQVIDLKRKVLNLSIACKKSSATFNQSLLK